MCVEANIVLYTNQTISNFGSLCNVTYCINTFIIYYVYLDVGEIE